MTTSEIIQAWLPTCGWLFGPLLFIYIVRLALPHFARRWFTCAMFVPYTLVICGFSMFVLLLFAASVGTSAVSDSTDSTKMTVTLPGRGGANDKTAVSSIYARPRITQANLHGLDGFRGVDVVGDGDPRIFAPFDGSVASVGCDGVAATTFLKRHPICDTEATWLDIRSSDGRYRMVLLHGDYEVQQGQKIRRGQHIGMDNCWGWCTGNHSHVILWDRGVLVSYLEYVGQPSETLPSRDLAGISEALARFGYSENGGNPLRVSHYDPSLGGTNCDSDCSTMASGHKVASWVGGQNGIYAAACPAEWPFGTRFEVYGKIYQCQDRGGWIKTRQIGEWDPAMGGFIAADTYHWVDLLDTPPVPYGALVHDWRFVK